MRVGVDARSLAANRGVAHYTGALLEALARSYPEDEWFALVPGREPLASLRVLSSHANVHLRRHRLPGRLLFASGALAGAPRLDRMLGGDVDVLWAPAPAPLALSAHVPLVLTIHDLSFDQRPGDFTAYERLWHRLARPRRLAERAVHLVVDSRATQSLLQERWGVEASRSTMVAPGVSRPGMSQSAIAAARIRSRLGLQRPYLLAVGALEPRKAPELLLRAFLRARADGLDGELVFAGGGRLAPRLRAPGVRVLGQVEEAELEALYTGAQALVMASWLEGYGLPPLEAIVRGTPPVVADLPVYEETLGAGAPLRAGRRGCAGSCSPADLRRSRTACSPGRRRPAGRGPAHLGERGARGASGPRRRGGAMITLRAAPRPCR